MLLRLYSVEPRHGKTNIMGLRPAWIQTSLRIHTVWSGSMLFAISSLLVIGFVIKQHGTWWECADAQAGLDPCWSQTHNDGFVVTQLFVLCMGLISHIIMLFFMSIWLLNSANCGIIYSLFENDCFIQSLIIVCFKVLWNVQIYSQFHKNMQCVIV
jgi:hypothetical protein